WSTVRLMVWSVTRHARAISRCDSGAWATACSAITPAWVSPRRRKDCSQACSTSRAAVDSRRPVGHSSRSSPPPQFSTLNNLVPTHSLTPGGILSTATEPPRRTSRWRWLLPALLLIAWLVAAGGGGPFAGKLSEVASNDASTLLPASAQSTRADEQYAKF